MNTEKSQKNSILLLHGWGSSHKSWEEVRKILGDKGIDVIIPDMPGFGDNPPPDKPWHGEDYENWVLNYIEENKLKKPIILIGHSFGGGLAMKISIKHPELVKKLVLISAARMYAKKRALKHIVYKLAKIGKKFNFLPFYELMRKVVYKFLVRSTDYTNATGTMKKTFVNIIKEDVTPVVHEIKAPTLIIWGDKDVATPPEHAYFLKKKINDSEIKIIKGGRHAINLQRPKELAEIIYNFIK